VVGAPAAKSNRQTSQNRPDLGVWQTGQDGAGSFNVGCPPAAGVTGAAGTPIRRPHASQ
jgi:hypothetical protein